MEPDAKISHCYDDIIDLPHHQSAVRPRMSRINRAAQFAPFAALTGYEAAIAEAGRITDECVELDESRRLLLGEKLQFLSVYLQERPPVTITFFEKDQKKDGGAYRVVSGTVRKIDRERKVIYLNDDTLIGMDQLFEIESPLFTCCDAD